jgi:hypothetical protein
MLFYAALSFTLLPAPCSSSFFPQHFIQRAGPEILVRDLPPKQEMLLALAPTSSQFELLQALNEILQANGRSLFRDIEVGRGPHGGCVCHARCFVPAFMVSKAG